MTLLRESIETYIYAKDGNRPHLLPDAFMDDAMLTIELKTDEISFPSRVSGIDGISAVLVSQFAKQYENVYTFCVGKPPKEEPRFDCYWLVCMTEKGTGAARVGFGEYQWQSDDETKKISKLSITIEEMNTLPGEWNSSILRWAQSLPYPWCPSDIVARDAPAFPPIQKIAETLKRLGGHVGHPGHSLMRPGFQPFRGRCPT
jgi:hypothetical protein